MQGRLHLYEGWAPQDIALAVHLLQALGRRRGWSSPTPPARSNPDFAPGEVMLIEDHLNFTGANPLTGPNDDRLGLRFPDMSRAYDPELRDRGAARRRKRPALDAAARHLCRRRRPLARDLGRAALPARGRGGRGGHVDGARGDRGGACRAAASSASRRSPTPPPAGRTRRPTPSRRARHGRGRRRDASRRCSARLLPEL